MECGVRLGGGPAAHLVLNKSKYYAVSMFAKLLVLYLQQNINSLVYI